MILNNIIFNWGSAGQEIQNFGGCFVDSGNIKDGLGRNSGQAPEPFPDPYRSTAAYYASVSGFPSTSVGFLSAVRLQSKANWNPALLAAAVNDYVRAGFGITGLAEITPADITACDAEGCISEAKLAANICNKLVNNVVGFSLLVGSMRPIYGGQARTSSDPPSLPMSPDLVTNIASVSKTITAIAILQLLGKAGLTVDAKKTALSALAYRRLERRTLCRR